MVLALFQHIFTHAVICSLSFQKMSFQSHSAAFSLTLLSLSLSSPRGQCQQEVSWQTHEAKYAACVQSTLKMSEPAEASQNKTQPLEMSALLN